MLESGAKGRIEGALRLLLGAWLRIRRSVARVRDSPKDCRNGRRGGGTRWDRRTSRAQRHWRRARQPQRDPPHAHLSPLRPYSRAPYTSCTTATYSHDHRDPTSCQATSHITAAARVSPRGVALLRALHAFATFVPYRFDHALPRIVDGQSCDGSTVRRVIITLGNFSAS